MLDLFFWQFFLGVGAEPEQKSAEEMKQILEKMPCSGYAYVVMNYPLAADMIKEAALAPGGLPLFHGEQVYVTDVCSEPPSIYWENFTRRRLWVRVLLGIL